MGFPSRYERRMSPSSETLEIGRPSLFCQTRPCVHHCVAPSEGSKAEGHSQGPGPAWRDSVTRPPSVPARVLVSSPCSLLLLPLRGPEFAAAAAAAAAEAARFLDWAGEDAELHTDLQWCVCACACVRVCVCARKGGLAPLGQPYTRHRDLRGRVWGWMGRGMGCVKLLHPCLSFHCPSFVWRRERLVHMVVCPMAAVCSAPDAERAACEALAYGGPLRGAGRCSHVPGGTLLQCVTEDKLVDESTSVTNRQHPILVRCFRLHGARLSPVIKCGGLDSTGNNHPSTRRGC